MREDNGVAGHFQKSKAGASSGLERGNEDTVVDDNSPHETGH